MSRTDINPPQAFSTLGEYTVSSQSWNPVSKTWNPPNSSRSFNQDRSGSVGRRSNVNVDYIAACNTGRLLENSFTFNRLESRRFTGERSYQTLATSPFRSTASGTFPSSFAVIPSLNSISTLRRFNLDNEVKQKLMEKVRDSDVNIAVAWGEREETLRMLSGSLKKLGTAFNQARSGNFAGAAKTLTGYGSRPGVGLEKSIANNWLELQYGWLPLMSDIDGLCKTLHKQVSHKEYVIVRASKRIQDETTSLSVSTDYEDYVVSRAEYHSSCRVKMKLSNMFLKTAAEVGLTNPLLVAWELVPFSFVIDWALPIGSFLSQFDSSFGWEWFSGSLTSYYKCTSVMTRGPRAGTPGYLYHKVNGQCSQEQLQIERVGLTSFARMLTLPVIKDPGSVVHCLNALALISSRR